VFVCVQIVPLPFATDADVKAQLTMSVKFSDNKASTLDRQEQVVRLAEDRRMITVEGLR
jgi:hypothetical protein